MKNKIKILSIIICMAVVMVFFPLTCNAASGKTKAMKAYRKFLAKNVSRYTVEEGNWDSRNGESTKKSSLFLTVDLNSDKIPELVTYHPTGYKKGTIYIYRYKKGKVKKVPVRQGSYAESKYGIFASTYTSSSLWGLYVNSCSRHHLHVQLMNGMGSSEYIFKITKGKVKLVGSADYNFMEGDSFTLGSKRVTAKKYNAYNRKCKSRHDFVSNTSANRKKYLK